ncbi:hypothetical protein [Streptomyces sp. UH6]|uniref:hypothetical protein n=1 Tax=Streptomyces sp. UH6 TaxID=2748379 RepID=UPI0015D523D1|nr:hypothetical protein [Streptomyces sp. UH6]NYV72961.1 hypothetical protein [Streptomyces sp. UH6]
MTPRPPSTDDQLDALTAEVQHLRQHRRLLTAAITRARLAIADHRAGTLTKSQAYGAIADSIDQLPAEVPAEDVLERVRAELDRIARLDTVTADNGRADSFAVGARWTLRMIREALDHAEATPAPAAAGPGLRERWRAAWRALTPEQQAARLAELDADDDEPELCGRTTSVAGDEYPPCARPAGHTEAYCRSADTKAYFLTEPLA